MSILPISPDALRGPLAVLVGAFVTAAAGAQSLPATAPAAVASAPKGALHAPYADGSFGFSVAYPEGSELEREKRFVTADELEIVRFVHLAHTWSLAVRLVTAERPLGPQEVVDYYSKKIHSELTEAAVSDVRVMEADTRPAARLTCRFKADDRDWIRLQAFVRKSTREYFSLLLLAPRSDEAVAADAFERILGSFRVLRSDLVQQRVDGALERGAELIRAVAARPDGLQALGKSDVFLRYIENGREIGFRHTVQTPREQDRRPGMFIREWGWLFREDGSITQLQYAMFLSNDLSYAEWDSRSRLFIPADAAKDRPAQSYFGMDMGLHKDGLLLVNYTPAFNADDLKEKAIVTEPSFASPAWFVLLPRLLDLNKPELYAFSAYDSDRRGLILRTVEVLGPTRVTLDGKTLNAIRIHDGEGLVPPFNEILVDPAGRPLRVQAGPIELIAASQGDIEKTYKARVDAALELLARYPVPLPSLPQRDQRE